MRKIVVMIGSDSDLRQCKAGLEYLRKAQGEGLVEVPYVFTSSAHRNTGDTVQRMSFIREKGIDVLIAGAGWANALTGICDAYLRYTLYDYHIVVVGVAFEDSKNPAHTAAAVSGITEVPGSQVVFDDYVGEEGFLRSCKFAAEGELPKIKHAEARSSIVRSLDLALKEASK